ncbi:MAG TPA: peptidylprolyl isomerase [Candidatus Angelobacter sp.]|nr:peptidylprolyl isomerase [Candidatus Angelobacter sp.]
MMRILVVSILMAACAAAQSQGPATPAPPQARPGVPAPIQPQSAAAHPEAVGNNEAVITVHGLCPDASAKSSTDCTTVVSKEKFEKILAAVNQSNAPMPPVAIRNLAEAYVQMMAFASQAEKLGLDKDPRFQEMMRIVRLNRLTEIYRRTMDEKYRNLSDAEIQAYYDKNLARFEQVKLGRVFIPRVNPKAPRVNDDFEQRAQKLAESLRDRAAKGEDLDKLQQEGYRTLGLNPPSLNTDAGTRRRGSGLLAPNVENDIFALKSGEVTKVEPEPAGFQFYKLMGRETLTLQQVKAEIGAAIRKTGIEAANKAVMDPIHTDLNETYFGPRSTGAPLTIPPPRVPNRPVPAPAAPSGSSTSKPVEPLSSNK